MKAVQFNFTGEESMVKNTAILTFILVIASFKIQAQKAENKTEDEKALRANVAQMASGWNTKSGADFAKPFAEDADYVVINGMYIKGRAAIAQGHQQIFDTFYKNTNLTLAVERIRFLRADVAVVHVLATLKLTENETARTTIARITMVMTKTGDKWEIAAFQNSEMQVTGGK